MKEERREGEREDRRERGGMDGGRERRGRESVIYTYMYMPYKYMYVCEDYSNRTRYLDPKKQTLSPNRAESSPMHSSALSSS